MGFGVFSGWAVSTGATRILNPGMKVLFVITNMSL
jgi:hypothetical protein